MSESLDPVEYQIEAKLTAIYPGAYTTIGLTYVTMGLVGEAGEIANKVKKILRDEGGVVTPEKKEQLADELGDVLWYAAMLCEEIGVNLTQVMRRNLKKLAARKQGGTLSGEGDNR